LSRGIDGVEGDEARPKGEINAEVASRELRGRRGGRLKEGDVGDRGLGGEEEEDALILHRARDKEVAPFPHNPRTLPPPPPKEGVVGELMILNCN
jgi:hypothetical protein